MDEKILEEIHKHFSDRTETVAESACLAFPKLLESKNFDSVCFLTHNINTIEDAIKLIDYSYGINAGRIVFITNTNDPMFYVYQKMKHIFSTLAIDRLSDIFLVIKKCRITKLFYCGEIVKDLFFSPAHPAICFPQYDDTKNFLNYNPQYIINHSDEYPEVRGFGPCVHFVGELFDINEAQIMINNEEMATMNNGSHCPNNAVDLAISLMLKYTMISINESKYNIFNYLGGCVKSTLRSQ